MDTIGFSMGVLVYGVGVGFFYGGMGSSIVWVLSCGSWCGYFGGFSYGDMGSSIVWVLSCGFWCGSFGELRVEV